MALYPRPSLRDVLAARSGDVPEEALHTALATLHADPNWRVESRPAPPTWELDLVYAPSGARHHLRLERGAGAGAVLWHRMDAAPC